MEKQLKPVDRAEVIILSDNYCDQVILSSEMVFRPGGLTVKPGEREVEFKAEHGFAAAVKLYRGDECRTLLLDTGRSGEVLLNNAYWANFDLEAVEAIVISHSHLDHVGGLKAIAGKMKEKVPVIVHPDAFLERYLKQADGGMMRFPDFHPELFTDSNFDFQVSRDPTYLTGDLALSTGQIPRVTSYEKGFPPQMALRDGKIVADAGVWDDQSLIFNVKGRGVVVISGCGHAGIVNSVRYAMELSGEADLLAVIGGFHLCWPTPDVVIRSTLEDLKEIGPQYIVPCHCTGWEANHLFAKEMASEFILSTVGCTISL